MTGWSPVTCDRGCVDADRVGRQNRVTFLVTLVVWMQIELGDRLEPCFHGVTPVPCNRINMKRKAPSFIEISTAEAGTLQLELTALSRAANDSKYEV